MEETIFGINPVLETLKSHPDRFRQIFLPTGNLKGKKGQIHALARQHNIKIELIPRGRFDKLAGQENHQGVMGIVSPYDYYPLDHLLNTWRQSKGKALFLILDGIEDPRNFGAIVRVANTVSAHGIIIPKHRSSPINRVVAKASAGALAYTPVCRVPNLVTVMETLKKEGVWIVGTAENGGQSLYTLDLSLDLAVVIGSEGKGMHSLVKKHCDFLVSIPIRGEISSLNAATAAAVVLYEIIRQRHYG